MGPNLKFSAYFAGSAFGIAFLTGIIAGVGFGTIILRALIGAAVFAGLGYGFYIVISTRLPELVSDTSASSATAEAEGYGQNVDIVVDDEDGVPGSEEELPAAEAEELEAADEAEGEAEELEEVTDDEPPGSPEGEDELVEEVEEVSASSGASGAAAGSERDDVDENSVDTLPDIGGFAGDFAGEGTEVVEDDEGTSSGSSRAREHGIQENPEVIAKALQTVIKRDE
jgi:hypothetical protein